VKVEVPRRYLHLDVVHLAIIIDGWDCNYIPVPSSRIVAGKSLIVHIYNS